MGLLLATLSATRLDDQLAVLPAIEIDSCVEDYMEHYDWLDIT